MKQYTITTRSGSTYRVLHRVDDDTFYFGAVKAEGKGAAFLDKHYAITRPMPWPMETGIPLWVHAASVEQDFPFMSGTFRTSPVETITEQEVAHA